MEIKRLEKDLFNLHKLQADLELLCEQYAGVVEAPQLSVHVLEGKVQAKAGVARVVRVKVEDWQLDTKQRSVEGYRSLITWNESFLVPLKSHKGVLNLQILAKDESFLKVLGTKELNLKDYSDQQRHEEWHSVGPIQLRLAIRLLYSRAVYYAQMLRKVLGSVVQSERAIAAARSESVIDWEIAHIEHELDPSKAPPVQSIDSMIWETWLKHRVGEQLMRRLLQIKLKHAFLERCAKIGLEAVRRPSHFKSKALSRLSLARQAKDDSLLQNPSRVTATPTKLDTVTKKNPSQSSLAASSDSEVFYDIPDASSSEASESGVQYIEDTPYSLYSRRSQR